MISDDVRRGYGSVDRISSVNRLITHLTEQAMDAGLFRTCLNCEHWIQGTQEQPIEQCSAFKARPPATVIVVGCDYHTDLIPF